MPPFIGSRIEAPGIGDEAPCLFPAAQGGLANLPLKAFLKAAPAHSRLSAFISPSFDGPPLAAPRGAYPLLRGRLRCAPPLLLRGHSRDPPVRLRCCSSSTPRPLLAIPNATPRIARQALLRGDVQPSLLVLEFTASRRDLPPLPISVLPTC